MIIAVDFDGVLCESQFPRIGPSDQEMIQAVKRVQNAGHETVLWTCRADQRLSEAVEWCEMHGLHFTSINDNTSSNKLLFSATYPNGTRKVFADVYIDDRNLGYTRRAAICFLNEIARLTHKE